MNFHALDAYIDNIQDRRRVGDDEDRPGRNAPRAPISEETMTTPTNRLRRDWRAHDAAIPYHNERRILLNGTNPAGRRPHTFVEPSRKTVVALLAANDNRSEDEAA
ncbi:hypothetical protein EB231_23280 [Mesorhizobium sp. NZP2298]|nr:hypothetical protein EB231_23280 [Mesorhizobium sp. NZP2298]